ncbi:MAG: hypothetical protein AAFX50_20030 [Acidobacteriota bacterium]
MSAVAAAVESPNHGWLPALTEGFEAWLEDRGPRGLGAGDADFAARWVGDRLRRGERLGALRGRLAGPPLDRIHPSWIAAALPDDPLVRLLCLGALPAPLRARVAREAARAERAQHGVSRGGEDGAPPDGLPFEARAALSTPGWVADWFHAELRRSLDDPAAPPWQLDRRDPRTYLDRLDAAELEAVLPRLGLRAFALALPTLDRGRAAELVFRLAPAEQDLLRRLSPGRHPDSASDPWARAFDALDGRLTPRLAELALRDLAANGLGHPALRRLAHRLPRRRGSVVLGAGAADDPLRDADGDRALAGWRRAMDSCLDDRLFAAERLETVL